jgi:hypothetical protein
LGGSRIVKGNRDVHTIRQRLADGSAVVYRYHRLSRTRILSEPGTTAFDTEIEAIRQAAKVRPAGLVYFVQARALGFVKIGVAADLAARMRAMRTSSPDHLDVIGTILRGGRALEHTLHRRFDAHRAHGEWFRPAPELLAYIAEHASLP